MKRKLLMKAASGAMAFVMAASAVSLSASAEEAGEWREEDGKLYWYENGVRQGYDPDNKAYRGKEIYDPGTNAWYWLDNVQNGAKAVSKDVYQESEAGQWGAAEGADGKRYGKWVRYDENGHMIKGWNTNEDGTYYFDLTFGTMAKGETTIDGVPCIFDAGTGIGLNLQWVERDGAMYWYEGGKRQGYDPNDAAYRGKEIYDPASNAWYWLDNDAYGKKAVSKDVYQESEAGQWGAAEGADGKRYGKWVRYDENGHMIKGWSTNENGTYYFDLTYGTMAKGTVEIDGVTYYFDENTGVCQGEVNTKTYYSWYVEKNTRSDADGNVTQSTTYQYDSEGKELSYTYKTDDYESTTVYDSQGRTAEQTTVSKYSWLDSPSYSRTVYTYEGDNSGYAKAVDYEGKNGTDWTVSGTTVNIRNAEGSVLTTKIYGGTEDDANLTSRYEYKYNDKNQKTEYISYSYSDGAATVRNKTYYEYDGNDKLVKETVYIGETTEKSADTVYTYDGNGNQTEYVYTTYSNGAKLHSNSRKYEYDANGNRVKETNFDDGKLTGWTEKTYRNVYGSSYYSTISSFTYDADGVVRYGYDYVYNDKTIERYNSYGKNKELSEYTVYDNSEFPKGEAGATAVRTNNVYDGSDNPIGKEVTEYKCYAYTR